MNDDTTENNLDYIALLQLQDFPPDQQEIGAREWRIRGIDAAITDLKKVLNKEDTNALNRYLRMCPKIDDLTLHLQSHYKEFTPILQSYIPKLHKKLS